MKQSVYNKKIRPSCAYCANGKLSCDESCVLCPKKGVMQPDSHCRSFVYDPLRRVPRAKAKLPEFNPEDFSIE